MSTPNLKADRRPISFIFHNLANQEPPIMFPLVVRPEELTRSDASRTSIHQTLGGAFVDSFGAGLPTIQISGITGWGAGNNLNGLEQFQALFDLVFARWHEDRKEAVASGLDPDKVKLIFVDELDEFAGVVVPSQFTLKRSKTRPLLSQYMINMTLISTDISESQSLFDIPVNAISNGIISINNALSKIHSFIAWLKTSAANVLGPIKNIVAQFTGLTANVLGVVLDVTTGAKSVVSSVTDPLMNIAGNLSRAAANVMSTVRTIVSLPQQVDAMIGRVGSAYENAACIISNVFNIPQFLPNYDDLYGASSCSSTAGGRPISRYDTENPFPVLLPIPGTREQYSSAAVQSINTLARSDTVLAPMNATTLSNHMSTIVSVVAA